MTPGFRTRAINALKIAAGFSLVFLLCQFLIGINFRFYETEDMNYNIVGSQVLRYPSFFYDPQVYGQFLVLTGFLFFAGNINKRKERIISSAIFLLVLLAIAATGARASIVGIGVSLAFLFFFVGNQMKKVIAGVVLVGFLGVYAVIDKLAAFNRGDSYDNSFQFRYSIWERAFDIFLQNPLLGIGIGNYQNHVSIYDKEQHWQFGNQIMFFDHPENGYLKFLTEFGIIGFVVIMIILCRPMVTGVRNYLKSKTSFDNILMVSSLLGWMVTFMTIYSLGDVRVLIVLVTLLCLLLTSNLVPKKVYVTAGY
jgi:O-antigen ligase